MLGGRIVVNRRRLGLNRRQLVGNRQQLLTGWCSAVAPAYRSPPAFPFGTKNSPVPPPPTAPSPSLEVGVPVITPQGPPIRLVLSGQNPPPPWGGGGGIEMGGWVGPKISAFLATRHPPPPPRGMRVRFSGVLGLCRALRGLFVFLVSLRHVFHVTVGGGHTGGGGGWVGG